MFANGNSFGADQGTSTGQGALRGERRSTEPFYIRLWSAIQPGAVS